MKHNTIDNQLAYRFTTYINNSGKISVPENMQDLYSKEVEIIVFIPKDKEDTESVGTFFYELINQYNLINEPDLNMKIIFNERENQCTRKFIFD